MRIRSVLAGFVAVVVGTLGVVVNPGNAAAAETPLGDCIAGAPPDHENRPSLRVPGNGQAAWFTPLGLVNNDALRVVAGGRIRIDHWGATKDIAGELPVAGSGWPAPGLRRYMLIGKVTAGNVWLSSTSRTYSAHEWFPVGADSGCALYVTVGTTSGGRLILTFNDDNLGDNGGHARVVAKQWI